jgi:hypothetical protein
MRDVQFPFDDYHINHFGVRKNLNVAMFLSFCHKEFQTLVLIHVFIFTSLDFICRIH